MLGSVWNGYGKVLLVVEEKGVLGPQCSPKHNAFDSSLCGCDLTTSISSPRTSHGNMSESAQTDDLPRQPSKKYSTSRCFAQRSSRARGPLRGWIQTAWRTGFLHQKSHQRSQSTGCVPVRKAPTNPLSQASANGVCQGEEKASSQKTAQQVKVDGDGASNTRQGVNVQFT